MGILKVLKLKKDEVVTRTTVDLLDRKLLNVNVHSQLIKRMKRLAAEFAVPRYVVTEHALEVGNFYLDRVLQSDEKRKMVRSHLDKSSRNPWHH